jgi:heme exporter protein D
MDIITQRFIAIGNRLLAELRLLRASAEQLNSTVHDAAEAQNQKQEQEPPILRAELQVPETIERQRSERDDRHYRVQVWLAVATTLAFVAAAVYAGIAVFQWYAILEGNSLTDQAMRNARRANARAFDVARTANGISQRANAETKKIGDAANQISRDALISVQRALVAFAGQGSYTKLPIGKKTESLRLTLPWMNSGSTPTRKGNSQINWQWLPSELPEKFNFPDLANVEHSRFVITPKAFGNATLLIPIGFMDAARKGNGHMFVWGWITYHDIFNVRMDRLAG